MSHRAHCFASREYCWLCCFFFFQAEDGIRDLTVTGVQTCALPILLMLVTVYEGHWMRAASALVQLDPTRMAQGIMTGIGFLGAGVIIKEGLSVRGLTTAASIWITAAIGILAGIGFYFPLLVSVVLTLGVLSLFRMIESRMPTQGYFHFDVRFARSAAMSEEQLRSLVESHGFSIANFSYRLERAGRERRLRMVVRCTAPSRARLLAVQLV